MTGNERMLENSAAYKTEEEIEAYYSKLHQESLKKYYSIHANREIKKDRTRLMKLVAAVGIVVVFCTMFLQLNVQASQHASRVTELQQEIEEIRQNNQDAQKRIADTQNLQTVRKRAEKLGMCYPKQKNIVYYTVNEDDYMIQNNDIPD